ncbi:MAG: DUF4338 domain-containing protein [Dechloromonas sp.]|nr:DUF4338 domain-containing protein [Candidatus Dechloromonas phosphoritropha]MBP8787962.1 DUF4338 domain-containing protein [Azonexus sp.]MBP9228473.1 DUF4338 domain-containing protein [Azonexus sp.]
MGCSRFTDHCYRAVDWVDLGLSTGRGLQDREHRQHGSAPKKRVLLCPLRHDTRQPLLNFSK